MARKKKMSQKKDLSKSEAQKVAQNFTSHFCGAKVVLKKIIKKDRDIAGVYIAPKKTIYLCEDIWKDIGELIFGLLHEIYHAKHSKTFAKQLFASIDKKQERLLQRFKKYLSNKEFQELSQGKFNKRQYGKLVQKIPITLNMRMLKLGVEKLNLISQLQNPKHSHNKDNPMYPHEKKADEWATKKFKYYRKNKDKLVKLMTTKGKYWKN